VKAPTRDGSQNVARGFRTRIQTLETLYWIVEALGMNFGLFFKDFMDQFGAIDAIDRHQRVLQRGLDRLFVTTRLPLCASFKNHS